MNINWTGRRGDFSELNLQKVEKEQGISFPEKYIQIVKDFNGAAPDKSIFDCANRKDCVFDSLINWDKSRKANVYFWQEIIKKPLTFPFAKDPFGNCLVFDFSEKSDPSVLFWDHETDQFIPVANAFDEFLASLREE